MYLVFTKKFSDTYWKLLGWIVYISLLATSLWFTWGVLEKFAKQERAIKQYEDKIEAHPTIAICSFALPHFPLKCRHPALQHNLLFKIVFLLIYFASLKTTFSKLR